MVKLNSRYLQKLELVKREELLMKKRNLIKMSAGWQDSKFYSVAFRKKIVQLHCMHIVVIITSTNYIMLVVLIFFILSDLKQAGASLD